jgi:hypothetical protein
MNPYKLREIYKYLTRAKKADPELPNVFPASKAPIPPVRKDVEEIEAINRFMRANPRTEKAGGGRIGFAEGDRGKGEYKRDSLSKTEQKKIKDAFPNTKFDFDKYRYGVKKYPNIKNQNITNKDYTKVIRFIKKGFTKGKGEGLNVRGQLYSVEGKRLSLQDQEKIKSLFKLPPGEEWDFKTHKYGIKQEGRENLLARIARRVSDKKPWKVAADFGSTEGWMILQMNRVFENETKAKVKPKDLTYQPVYKEINGAKRIIGFKDNTTAGGGNHYYGLNRHAKKNATNFLNHGDFKLNQKLVDISKRSLNQPNEVITGLLKDKGFTGKVNLNQLINFLSGTEATSAEVLKNAVVRHHNSGVAFGSATNDLSLTTQIINTRIRNAEANIRQGNILQEDIQLLKNNNVFVRGRDGKLYGSGATTPIGQFKQIEKGVETALQEGVDFKGRKFSDTQLKNFLAKIGCPGKGKAYGGRIQFQEGLSPEVCMTRGAQVIQEKRIDSPAQKANFNKMMKVATVGKNMALLKDILGPYGLGGDVLLEGMIAVNKTLTGGTPFKESWQDSWLSSIVGGEYDEAGQKLGRQKLFELRSGLSEGAEEFGDYNRKVDEYYDLIAKRNNLDLFKGSEDLADTSQEFKSVDNKIKTAERELGRMETRINAQGGFEAAENEFNRKTAERQDADAATSLQSIGRQFVDANQLNEMLRDDFSNLSSDALPMQKEPRPVLSTYETFKPDIPTLPQYKSMYEEAGITPPDNRVLEQDLNQERFRQLFTQPGFMGASDTFFGDTIKMAGGGIAKLAGIDQGPPPASGPNSQGLPGLIKRVRNR